MSGGILEGLQGLPTNPMFLLGLDLLLNEGRPSGGGMQAALGAAGLNARNERNAKLDKMTEEDQARSQRAMAMLAQLFQSGGMPGMPGAMTPNLMGPGPNPLSAGPLQSSFFGPFEQPPAAPGGGQPAPAAGGSAPAQSPAGAPPPELAQRLPAQGPRGQPGAVPPMEQVIPILLAGGRAQQAMGVNLLSALYSRKPGTRRIVRDKDGRPRYEDTGELVFDLPETPGKILPFEGKGEFAQRMNAVFEANLPTGVSDEERARRAKAFAGSVGLAYAARPRTIDTPEYKLTIPELPMGAALSAVQGGGAPVAPPPSFVGTPSAGAPSSAATPNPAPAGLPASIYGAVPTRLNENEQRINMFGMTAVPAIKALNDLELGGFNPATPLQEHRNKPYVGTAIRIGEKLGIVPDAERAAEYGNVSKDLAATIARMVSGAAIKEDEIRDELEKNAPRATDTPREVARKSVRRTEFFLNALRTVERTSKFGTRDNERVVRETLKWLAETELPRVRAKYKSLAEGGVAPAGGQWTEDQLRLFKEAGIEP